MIENLSKLSELADGTTAVVFGDSECPIKRLPLSKFAEGTSVMRASRQKEFTDSTRLVPMPVEVRAKAMAEIACATITVLELVDDWAMRLQLMRWALSLGGFKGDMNAAIDGLSMEDVGTMLDLITGLNLLSPKDDTDENPTTSTGPEP